MLADTRLCVIAVRPPLSCRTSPPPGGRSNVTSAFANHQCKRGAVAKPISSRETKGRSSPAHPALCG
ncbi:MAG: hypothetical protein EOR93_01650 [Mesorhizobium sp.]|nr:MAG: hypothetical protein EOR93_01650 [Mesorhizobium sp.]